MESDPSTLYVFLVTLLTNVLPGHLCLVAKLSVRINRVIATSSPSMNESARRIASRKLAHLQKSLDSIDSVVNDTSKTITDMCLLQKYEERVVDINRYLAKTRDDLHRMKLDETDQLLEHQDQLVFNCSVKIKKLISSIPAPFETSTSLLSESKGVKLRKLNVPTFDGNILNWRSFWEQFCISVHNRISLSDSKNLVYLQKSLKGGSAKGAIEGLSHSGENYTEPVECLQFRYNRPHLIHKAYVRAILDTPALKEGSDKELRNLHDTVQHHLRALKAMGCEAPGHFITSILQLRLNQNTLFEWNKHSQESAASHTTMMR